jgi:hypothetical protein
MRTWVVLAFVSCLTTSVYVSAFAASGSSCLVRLADDKPIGDSVTVLLNDSTLICGTRPIVLAPSFGLYLRKRSGIGTYESVTIPVSDISSISYRKHRKERGILILVGFFGGMAAGVAIGLSMESDSDSGCCWDFAPPAEALLGGLFGGLVGAAIGADLAKHMSFTVTLDCK